MKKVKNYIEADLAKKKIARYKFWVIKDEAGVTICSSSDNNPNDKSFSEVLDKILKDNIDAEVQVRFGTSEASSRQNPPFFIRVNESIEWLEPETESTVSINGVPQKVDRNGNVNINFTPAENDTKKIEGPIDYYDKLKSEMELQLTGIRNEHSLKEQKLKIDLNNQLKEQQLQFKEQLLADRENRLSEREQVLTSKEQELGAKKEAINDDLKGYLKQVPSVLAGLAKNYLKSTIKGEAPLAGTEVETPKPKKQPAKRREVEYEMDDDIVVGISDDELEPENELFEDAELEEEIENTDEENNNQPVDRANKTIDNTDTDNQTKTEDEKV